MLDRLTLESFQPYVNETFQVLWDPDGSLAVTLVECSATGHAGRGRQQFHVIFTGPLQPILPQRIYKLTHEQLGALDLFLVPIGPDSRGMQYEAVFT